MFPINPKGEPLNNSALTEEEFRDLDTAVHHAARMEVLQARKLFGTEVRGPLGEGVQRIDYDEDTETGVAIIDMDYLTSEDTFDTARATQEVPINQKDFKVSRRDLLSSRRSGTPLDKRKAETSTYAVRDMEEKYLILGWDPRVSGTYQVYGLYQDALNNGVTDATAADLGAAGKSVTVLKSTLAAMGADGVNVRGPMNWSLNPVQYYEAVGSYFDTGVREMEMVEKLLETSRGADVYNMVDIPAGKGLVTRIAGWGDRRLDICVDLRVETEDAVPKKHGILGSVHEILVPIVFEHNSGAAQTAI